MDLPPSRSTPRHCPVLLQEVVASLELRPGASVLDATVGLGGHASALLQAVGPQGFLVGIDRDPRALEMARSRLASVGGNFSLYHGRFSAVQSALRQAGLAPEGGLHGVLFDLGVSSYQLDTAERGFSFQREGPLDLRMDPTTGETALGFLQRAGREETARVLREFGEESAAKRIAAAIERSLAGGRLATTVDLARLVEQVVPRGRGKIHPATKTFQALRIQINGELDDLRQALSDVDRYLCPGGRVAVLSYHSLEDRIVKETFRAREREGILEIVSRDVQAPREEEVEENPRARSARLRVAVRRA